jgi:hypothetical protein
MYTWTTKNKIRGESDMTNFPELLGSIEFARELGFDRRKFSVYLGRDKFPAPVTKVGNRSFWTREQVTEYILDQNRAMAEKAMSKRA